MNVEKLNQFMDEVRDLNRTRFGAFGEVSGRRSIQLNEQYAKYIKLLGNLFTNVKVIEVNHGFNKP